MTEKTEALKFSEPITPAPLTAADDPITSAPRVATDFEDYDSAHVTLARALEEARASRDATLQIKTEMLGEIARFRAAVLEEKRDRKRSARKFDAHDLLLLAGLTAMSGGIAAAYHWSYALIAIGCVLSAISLFPLLRAPKVEVP